MLKRFERNPLVDRLKCEQVGIDGSNICGPSIIRVPNWCENKLGKYYMYFAHHRGSFIRLAYAWSLEGPWAVYGVGVIDCSQTESDDHVASPDVHVLPESSEIVMYFHGREKNGGQYTYFAKSRDGLSFVVGREPIAPPYLRAFKFEEQLFGVAMVGNSGGVILRATGHGKKFTPTQKVLPRMRHASVKVTSTGFQLFYTEKFAMPERIIVSEFGYDAAARRFDWKASYLLAKPHNLFEGINAPKRLSLPGPSRAEECALRDPFYIEDLGKEFLFYCGGGERNICGGELFIDSGRVHRERLEEYLTRIAVSLIRRVRKYISQGRQIWLKKNF